MLLLGNEAVARGAWEAGVKVVSSYPGTPSTEITESIARYEDVYCEWAPNEKVALEVAIGASIAGARAMCCMKHVGLNVAADPLFTSSYTGVNGGLVIVVADDPGMHSSQNEQDSRFYALASHVPMLEPSDSEECRIFTKLAFEISEEYDCPVILRLTTRISHSRGLVNIQDKESIGNKEYVKDIMKYVMMPGMAKRRHLVVEDRMNRLSAYSNKLDINRIEWNSKSVGIITSGISYQYVKEVFKDASVLKIGMVHPLPLDLIKQFAEEVQELVVIEELEPFIENHVRQMGIKVKGKELTGRQGELSTTLLRKQFLNEEIPHAKVDKEFDIPNRPPVMCPGCPHRAVFHVLSRMKVRVSGDIGCYTLGALPPYNAVDACVCMGASVSMAHGMAKAGDGIPTVAVIGDSTFIHSGITSLIDIAYNKGNSTVIILDNSITGMTGHQHNPTTGYTIRGEEAPRVNLVKLAEAIGVKRVFVIDPFNMKEFRKLVEEEIDKDETSVIIAQRPCALLKTVNYGKPVYIDQEACRKCGNCMRLGCPTIYKEDDEYRIDEALCAGCKLCTDMCAFGAIKKEEQR